MAEDDLLNNRALSALLDMRDRMARMEERGLTANRTLQEMREENREQHAIQRKAMEALEARVNALEADDSKLKNRMAGGLAVLTIAWPIVYEKVRKLVGW
jgi:polyhydroxyalkanoate synthesis regulator phasin